MNFLSQLEEFKRELDNKQDKVIEDITKLFVGSDKSVVNVHDQNLTPNEFTEIFDSIRSDRSVRKLILSRNKICYQVALQLVVLLLENQYIRCLDLSYCDLNDKKMKTIIFGLECRKMPLTQLLLDGNTLSPEIEDKALSLTRGTSGPNTMSIQKDGHDIINELVVRNSLLRDMLQNFSDQGYKKKHEGRKKIKDMIKHKKVTIDITNFQVKSMKVRGPTSGSPFSIFLCNVDGWQCCMKEMSLEGVSEADVRVFLGEIEILEKVPYHKNIVRYLFHQRTQTTLRLFISWYQMSLKDVIEYRKAKILCGEGTYFHPRTIAKIAFSIANGLEFLQKHNIIHRDLKPENILCNLDADNSIFNLAITDFHSAKRITKKNQAKTIIGTPSYMSPEVLSSDNVVSYTRKVDIWGIGMVLYEMITLMVPYEDEDFSNVKKLILTGKHPSMHHISPIYNPLLQIFKECSQLDPSQRPDVVRVKEMLLQAIHDYDIGVYSL